MASDPFSTPLYPEAKRIQTPVGSCFLHKPSKGAEDGGAYIFKIDGKYFMLSAFTDRAVFSEVNQLDWSEKAFQ